MDIEHSVSGRSPLNLLDARTRLLGAVIFSVVAAFLTTQRALVCALGLSILFIVLARPSFRIFLRHLFSFNLFMAFLWLFVPWGMPGERLFGIGDLSVSREGIRYMATVTLRANVLVLALLALMATTPITAMTSALIGLKVPDKITYLFFLTYRYVGEISGEYARLVNAMRIRCFRPDTSIHTYRSYAYLVGMLLVNSFERAQRIRSAMLCRGFTGRFPHIDGSRISRLDILVLFVLSVLLAGIVYADI
jgi:cobalt/nickel transport system permease protein